MRGTQIKQIREASNELGKKFNVSKRTAYKAIKKQFKTNAKLGLNKKMNGSAAFYAFRQIIELNK